MAKIDASKQIEGTYATMVGVTMATSRLLGRTSASAGAAEEITVGSGLSLAGGTITLGTAGVLQPANGGTGTATVFTAGSIVFAGASGVYTEDNANIFWDVATHRLGVGTATPSERFVVQGNTLLNGSVAMGGTALNTNNVLTASANVVDPAAGDWMGAYFSRTIVLSAANAAVVTGFFGSVSLSANAFNQTGIVQGSYAIAANQNTATVTNVYGANNLVYNVGTGTITNAIGTQSIVQNLNASGIITNLYCVSVSIGFNNGTITNTYGIYVGDITAGAQTNTPYSFYASDPGALNYFGGTVVLGSLLTLKGYTVATLPAGTIGQCAYATDLLAPAFFTAVVGGGAVKGPVFYDGTAWVAF